MSANVRRTASITIALVISGVILFFGLRPKDLTLANNISWLNAENGIQVNNYGIAFSPPFLEAGGSGSAGHAGLTIELAFQPQTPPSGHFSFLMVFDNGDDSRQLLLGQWRTSLIAMNGDDYAHRRKLKRISVNTAKLPGDILFLTIVTGDKGTRFYCNGKPVATRQDLTLKLPAGSPSRLIVGNSAYGKHTWQGAIFGLAIYRHLLTTDTINTHYHEWQRDRHFGFALQDRPLVAYALDEGKGEKARDLAGTADLELPRRMKVLRREVLTPPWKTHEYNRDFFVDAVLNFIAFIPFGFCAVAALKQLGGRLKAKAFHLAALIGIMTSLLIELTQCWLPSRSSTLLDLILNSLGAVVGVVLYGIVQKRRICSIL